jgi:hypothetical protein
MQHFDNRALAAICMAAQANSRAGLPVAFVGAGLPELKVRLLAAKPYADRLFSYAELRRLSDAAARSALVGPAAAAGVDIEEAAARQIVDEAAGFPYFIQWARALELRRVRADHDGRPRRGLGDR